MALDPCSALDEFADAVRLGAERIILDARAALAKGDTGGVRSPLTVVAETALVPDALRRDAIAILAQIDGEEFTLARTGDAPLRLRGVLLAEGDSERRGGNDTTRHHELAVYRTGSGRYVVRIAYRTTWQGEGERLLAIICDTPDDVIACVRGHDPVPPGIGLPPGEHFAAKQVRIEESLRSRWGVLASQVLAKCGFSERVE